jgi:hypothetical protein
LLSLFRPLALLKPTARVVADILEQAPALRVRRPARRLVNLLVKRPDRKRVKKQDNPQARRLDKKRVRRPVNLLVKKQVRRLELLPVRLMVAPESATLAALRDPVTKL